MKSLRGQLIHFDEGSAPPGTHACLRENCGKAVDFMAKPRIAHPLNAGWGIFFQDDQPLLLNEGMKEERERGGCPGVLLRKPIPQSWHSICGPPLKQTWAIFPGPCNAPGGITDFSLISVNIIGGKILKITRPKLITTVSFGSVWKCVYVMSTNLPTSAEDR